MTAEGILPKIDGDVFYAADVDRLLDTIGSNFRLTALKWLIDGEDDREMSGQYSILVRSGSEDYDSVDSVNTQSIYGVTYIADEYDDFPGVALDTTLWTNTQVATFDGSNTTTVGGGILTLASEALPAVGGATNTVFSNGSVTDFKLTDGDCTVFIQVGTKSGTGSAAILAADGPSSYVQIVSVVTGTLYEIYYDSGTENAYYRSKTAALDEWTSWSGAVDLSSLGATYYIAVQSGAGAAQSGSVQYKNISYVQGAVTGTIQMTGQTLVNTGTAYSAMLFPNITTGYNNVAYTSMTLQLSADDSNFETAVLERPHYFSTTGTSPSWKMTVTTPADEGFSCIGYVYNIDTSNK